MRWPRTRCISISAICRPPPSPPTISTSGCGATRVMPHPLLREFASAADEEADGAKGAQWSYRRDLGAVRLLVIDSRCGRVLANGRRTMVSEPEFAWIEQQAEGDDDHLLVRHLAALAAPTCTARRGIVGRAGRRGPGGARIARWAEKLRRAADLEHWASMRESFDRLADLFGDVGRGRYNREHGRAPATICVLSGDVHHAYVAAARYPAPDGFAGLPADVLAHAQLCASRYETGLSIVLERARGTGGSLRIGTVRHDATDENLVGQGVRSILRQPDRDTPINWPRREIRRSRARPAPNDRISPRSPR